MPFLEASPAARRRRMLCDENGMTLEGSLLPVVHGRSWSESSLDEVPGMIENLVEPATPEILGLLWTKRESPPKGRGFERCENFLEIPHAVSVVCGLTPTEPPRPQR